MAAESRSRIKAVDVPKSMGQTYYEEVETLKGQGVSNADAVREIAKKHDKNENAVRGGIHQYRARHLTGAPSGTRRSRRTSAVTVEDYVATAQQALESARALIDREVTDAKTALDTAQKHYDDVVAAVKERKADIERKLKALA